MNTKNRLNNLRREMANFSIKGFLVTSNKNCQYISGFSGSNGYIFSAIGKDDVVQQATKDVFQMYKLDNKEAFTKK